METTTVWTGEWFCQVVIDTAGKAYQHGPGVYCEDLTLREHMIGVQNSQVSEIFLETRYGFISRCQLSGWDYA